MIEAYCVATRLQDRLNCPVVTQRASSESKGPEGQDGKACIARAETLIPAESWRGPGRPERGHGTGRASGKLLEAPGGFQMQTRSAGGTLSPLSLLILESESLPPKRKRDAQAPVAGSHEAPDEKPRKQRLLEIRMCAGGEGHQAERAAAACG
ncbi:unnamed protein product [Lampetra planeri]